MITEEALERVRGWFSGRLPEEWTQAPPTVQVDREEISVTLELPPVKVAEGTGQAGLAEARAGRAKAFREDARESWMAFAREAQHRFVRKDRWSVVLGD